MDFLLNIIGDINEQTSGLTSSVYAVQNWMWSNFLYYALIAAGLYITIRTRGVQWRSIKEMVRVLGDPVAREADGKKSISSFRAFTVSAASRVGTGTVAGVALAIAMGGPGAVFWMWVIAAVGAASAFAESLLGQLYKERGKDSYIGGPAYYMKRGLNARWMGYIFVAFIVITYAFVFVAVQTNAVVDATSNSLGIDVSGTNSMGFRVVVGAVMVLLTAAIIFGGIRAISSVTEWLVPIMAVLYLLLGLLVVLLNITEIPNMLLMIFQGAFGLKEFVTGGTMGAVIWGMKRGLLTNEAGMGTAPNAGATATISHPAKQGYVQTLGVYFDTMMACTVTAFIVLLSNPAYGDRSRGASLTQSALAMQVLVFVFFGAISSLDLVWTTADMLNAGMVIVNLTAVLLMTPKVVAVLKNYEAQRKAGLEPIFKASDLPEIKNLAAWDGTDVVTTREFWAEYDAKTAERRKLKAAKKAAKAGR